MKRLIFQLILFISFFTLPSPPISSQSRGDLLALSISDWNKLIAFQIPPKIISDSTGFKMVSDSHSSIEALVIHCPWPDDPFLYDLISGIRKDIKFGIAVPSQEIAHQLFSNLKTLPHQQGLDDRIRFIISEKSISKWGRDAYTVLYNQVKNLYTLLPSVLDENRREGWEDDFVKETIIKSQFGLPNIVENSFSIPSTWGLDGGSITADKKYAYIGEGTVLICQRNAKGEIKASRKEIIKFIDFITNKETVVLPAGDLHSDRYHMPVGKTAFGERTSLLADPVKLLEIIASLTPDEKLKAIENIRRTGLSYEDKNFRGSESGRKEWDRLEARLSVEELRSFFSITKDDIKEIKKSLYVKWLDKAERILKKRGIKVVRIPTLDNSIEVDQFVENPSGIKEYPVYYNAPVGFYYLNVIQDRNKDGRYVIIPKYGIEKLDRYVRNVFTSLGCYKNIHQVRNVIEGTEGGGPRCRVQTFGRFFSENPFLKHVLKDK